MAIIPNDEKFIGLSASYPTVERRSSLINAESQVYTMQDITDTVSAGLPPATNPASNYVPINFGGEFADSPINAGIAPAGYLGWAKVTTKIGAVITAPPGVDQTNVAPFLPSYGLSIANNPFTGMKTVIGDYNNILGGFPMRLNIETPVSSQGKAYIDSGASVGLSNVFDVNADGTVIRLGQGYTYTSSSLYNGIFSDSGLGMLKLNGGMASPDEGIFMSFMGLTRIGSSNYSGFGINAPYNSLLIGSFFMEGPAPTNPTTPAEWVAVVNQDGVTYMMPLYQ